MMKICAYVQEAYAKSTYKTECLDTRQFVGLRVVMDALERSGYPVEWAGIATVHEYDLVLVSITSDCDWWSFIKERMRWRPGNYKVIIGGAGVLHVTPFLPFGDYFALGRGEASVPDLVRRLNGQDVPEDDSIIESNSFSAERKYRIRQVDEPYPHRIPLSDTKNFQEGPIGCNHRCLFCGYTWHRKFVSDLDHYAMEDSLFGNIADKERAMLDLSRDKNGIDFAHLRTTAIDGMSERLRRMVGKPITRSMMEDFIRAMLTSNARPHQIKFYNIVGYPGETEDDWMEYLETLREADLSVPEQERQWSIVLHSTPFRPMPATPLACAPMSKRNYRGELGRVLGPGLRGNLIYQGRSLWSVESMGTESLASVMLSAVAHRGGESDSEAVRRLCASRKFWRASAAQREATLERYFDMERLFGTFTPETLPSRYLTTWCSVERFWDRRIWEEGKYGRAEDAAGAAGCDRREAPDGGRTS